MQLQIYHYQDQDHHDNVRTIEIDGDIWFVANDICKVLEYKRPNDAIRQHCKMKGTAKHRIPSESGDQLMLIINEPNVYRLILRSNMPRADQFEDWLLGEVLPSIRKTGRYGVVPIFVRRFNDNWDRVERGYFSIISELFIRVYGKLEQAGHIIPDHAPDGKEIRPDISVGQSFPKWLEKNHPDKTKDYKFYNHILPGGMEVKAKQYKDELLPLFIKYIEEDWLINRAPIYFKERDQIALTYLPKIIEGRQGIKKVEKLLNESSFNKVLRKIANTSPPKKESPVL